MRRSKTRVGRVVLTMLLGGTFVVLPAQQATAGARPDFQAPAACDAVWTADTYDNYDGNGHGGASPQYKALDLNAAPDNDDLNTPVLASASGTATSHTQTVPNSDPPVLTGYGRYVDISHGNGWKTRYAHLESTTLTGLDNNPNLSGIQVSQGDQIGKMGTTGTSTAVHLHYEQLLYNESTSSYVPQLVKFDGAQVPYWIDNADVNDPAHWASDTVSAAMIENGPASVTSANCAGSTESYDASPSIALTEDDTVAVNNTERSSGNNRTLLSAASSLSFSTNISTGTTGSGWATGGTGDLANDPSQDDTVWLAALKETASAHARLYVYEIEDGDDTQRAKLEVGEEDDQWSLTAAPSIIVDGDGNVYVAAVQADGDMSMFKINGSTLNVGRVDIGGDGSWSTTGTVTLALAPDDAVWLAAVTNDSVSEIRTYRGDPHSLTFSSYGAIDDYDWTVDAAPGITVDNDGDVTVAAVRADNDEKAAMWAFRNDTASYGDWVKITDDVGADPEWSTHGSLNLVARDDANDTVYLTGVRNHNSSGSQQGAELQVFTMTPASPVTSSTWSGIAGTNGLGAYTDWSPYSAPDIVLIDGSGSVFVVAVKLDGSMYAFKRTSGTWGSAVQVGTSGGTGWSGNQS